MRMNLYTLCFGSKPVKPLILFDFDGTLVDSVDMLVSVVNNVAVEHGYTESFSKEGLRKHSVPKLIRRMGVPFWKLNAFVEECRERFAQRVHEGRLHAGIRPLLEDLAHKAVLGVVSSNAEASVRSALEEHGVLELFSYVDGGSYFAKNRHISQVRKQAVVDTFFTLYVGDESRDVHAARRAGVDCLAVTWGVQGEQGLLKVRPRMMAHTVHEAEHLIKAWMVSRGD